MNDLISRKNDILKILESAKDKRGSVPMSLVRKAFDKLPSAQPDAPETDVGSISICRGQQNDDLISRQAAIDALRDYVIDDMTSTEKAIGADYCIGLIKILPSAEPEPNCSEIPNNWIPVSERLPDKYGTYITSERWYAIGDRTHDGDYREKTSFAEFNDGKFRRALECVVIAWMPLPAPFRPKEDES